MNSMTPPAIRKLAEADPERVQHRPPEQRKEHQDRPSDERGPERHRAAVCRASLPRVRPAKIGAQPGGSMMTRKVTSAEPKSSIMEGRSLLRRRDVLVKDGAIVAPVPHLGFEAPLTGLRQPAIRRSAFRRPTGPCPASAGGLPAIRAIG